MAAVAPQRRRYQHGPLEHPDSIRLLHLLPGLFEDEIQVELREVTLSQQPRYEALSYVWGSPTADDPISCHGEELFVTANCVAAMRRLRHWRKHRVLWIDAICINQNSTNERNHQVRLMGNVYSKATRAIIWLGEEMENSDSVMSFLIGYDRILRQKWLRPVRDSLLGFKLKKLSNIESSSLSQYHIFDTICDNPWFHRKWTVQEYALSRDSYFQFGGKRQSCQGLFSAIQDARWRKIELSGEKKYSSVGHGFATYCETFEALRQAFRDDVTGIRCSLLEVLHAGRAQIATEPRDAVFGLYGILQRMNANLPLPDYSKSVEQIYTEIGKLVIVYDKSLHILRYTSEKGTWTDLPSWVPDWSARDRHGFEWLSIQDPEPRFTSGRDVLIKYTFLKDHRSLIVRGCFVEKIQHQTAKYIASTKDYKDFGSPGSDQEGIIDRLDAHNMLMFQDWIRMAASEAGDMEEVEFKELLLCTLRTGWETRYGATAKGFEEWVKCLTLGSALPTPTNREHLISISGSSSIVSGSRFQNQSAQTSAEAEGAAAEGLSMLATVRRNQLAWDFYVYVYYTCRRTRLFITSGGLLGKGLKAIREGDFVALIAGVDYPMILRKEGDSYRSKGPAYIHNMMKGERWPADEGELIDIVLS
ncbi:HET-domain-containing protein [Hyaloscypha variabilis F]|uniref:HET-domain-containing protein n=1 Tax=Hyaloscypha variabilis (strain UAMH 11265 / GT02V1 / F) TaxID=1149755 RepID=A0A2J6R0K9_HYAVF|nr:HET-domain-containing protein [Hyaloscypha variabilis F]